MTATAPGGVLLGREALETVPPPPSVSSGYRQRRWETGDDERIPRLLGEAFGPRRASYAALQEFWRTHPGIEPRGIIVIETAQHAVVATASTRMDPDAAARGWIHLVAVRSDHRRCGLGTLVMLTALQQLAGNGARHVWVGTAAHRLSAIRVYLRLGFEPIIDDGEMCAAWTDVRRALAAEAVESAAAFLARIDAALQRWRASWAFGEH